MEKVKKKKNRKLRKYKKGVKKEKVSIEKDGEERERVQCKKLNGKKVRTGKENESSISLNKPEECNEKTY